MAQAAGALAGMAIIPDVALAERASSLLRGGQVYKVGVIGVGRQGRTIVDTLQTLDGIEVAAVCDVIPARVPTGLDPLTNIEGFTDHRELLERRTDLDAVFVATPTHLHRQVAIDALDAGRHVYCEAPLASTLEDCQALVAAAAAAGPGRVFQVGFQGRSNPIYKQARTLVRSDSVRDVIGYYAQDNRKTTWRFPGPDPSLERAANWRLDPAVSIGLAGELGSHQFDVLSWLRGRIPSQIRGTGAIRLHHDGRELPDTVQLELTWPDGLALQYHATLASSFGGRYEVVRGSTASIRLAWSNGWLFKETDAATQGWEVYAARQQFQDGEGIVLNADATKLEDQQRLMEGEGLPYASLHYSIVDFLLSFVLGEPNACPADEAMRSTLLGMLGDQAVRTGETVDVPAL